MSDGTVKTEWRWPRGEGVHTQRKEKKKKARMSAQSDQSGGKDSQSFSGLGLKCHVRFGDRHSICFIPAILTFSGFERFPHPDARRSNTT